MQGRGENDQGSGEGDEGMEVRAGRRLSVVNQPVDRFAVIADQDLLSVLTALLAELASTLTATDELREPALMLAEAFALRLSSRRLQRTVQASDVSIRASPKFG